MASKHSWNLFINKAINHFEDGNLDDAENLLLQAKNICDNDRVKSILKQIQDAKASLIPEIPTVDFEMAEENSRKFTKDLAEMTSQKPETMAEKETRMLKNMVVMRIRILSMQIDVAADRIVTHKRPAFIVDNTKETNKYRKKAERALYYENFDEANIALCKAEKLYSEMSAILFPVRVREEPNNEYVRMQKPIIASNSHVLTAGVNKEEVVACLKKAETAFSGGDLKKAEKWLLKSLRMCPTLNAQQMLSKIQKAISEAEEAAKPDSNTDDNIEQNDGVSAQNIEQIDISNLSEADKCFEAAKKALAEEDFDKSERLFLKVKRMNRSLDVDDFLKKIQAAKASRSSSETCRENHHNNMQESSATPAKGPSDKQLKEEAEVYLEIAQNALKDRNVERAEQFISKSINCFPTKRTEELQKKIDAFKSRYNKKESEPKVGRPSHSLVADTWKENRSNTIHEEIIEEEPSPELSNQFLKEEAETYLKIALNALNERNIGRAEHFLQRSLKSCRTERAVEIEKEIDCAKLRLNEKSYQRPTYVSMAKQQPRHGSKGDLYKEIYEKYIENAEDYLEMGYNEGAKRNVLEAKRLCPRYNKKIDQLLTEIEKREQRNINSKQSNFTEVSKDIQSEDIGKCAAIDKASLEKELQNKAAACDNKNELAKLLEAGIDASDSGNLTYAEQHFQKAFDLEPNEYNKGLLMQVRDKLHPKNIQSCKNYQIHSKNEHASKGVKLNTEDSLSKNSSLTVADSLKLLDSAQNFYDKGDIINAESTLIIVEDINSCLRSRELYIKIMKAKHNKKRQYDIYNEKQYLNKAENAYIQGNFDEALDFIQKANQSNPYVKELQKKFVEKGKQGPHGAVKFFVNIKNKVVKRLS